MGLLALIIGFIFLMALMRFEARREAVLNEANAIGTTALRARLLPAPHREESLKLLREYAQIRIIPAGKSFLVEYINLVVERRLLRLLGIIGAYLVQGLLNGEFVDFSHYIPLSEGETTRYLRQNLNYSNTGDACRNRSEPISSCSNGANECRRFGASADGQGWSSASIAAACAVAHQHVESVELDLIIVMARMQAVEVRHAIDARQHRLAVDQE